MVHEVDASVTPSLVTPGDRVIPLSPECRQCKSCLSQKTNSAPLIAPPKARSLMSDGTSRFSYKVNTTFYYMGCRLSRSGSRKVGRHRPEGNQHEKRTAF